MSVPNRKQTTSSPAKKRKLSEPQQTTIHSFFERPPQKHASGSSRNTPRGIDHPPHTSEPKPNTDEDEDDEAMAHRLAAEDGVSVDTARTLERKWASNPKNKRAPSASSSSLQARIQIIDVDAEDGEPDRDSNSSNGRSEVGSHSEPEYNPTPNLLDAQKAKGKSPRRAEAFRPKLELRLKPIDISSYPNLTGDPLNLSVTRCPWSWDNESPTETPPTPYSFLSHILCSLSQTRSRIAITNCVTNALRFIIYHDPAALLPALYLLSNSLAPPYMPVELGLGPSTISKAIQQVSGLSSAALKRLYTKTGDPGDVAYEAKNNLRTLVPHTPLTVTGVFSSLLKICHAKGVGATKQRQSIAERLLLSANGEEARYLVRTLSQHIRVGAVRTTILTGLGRALVLTRSGGSEPIDSPYYASRDTASLAKPLSAKGKKKENEDPARTLIAEKFANAEGLLRRTYVQHPNFEHIAKAIIEFGLEGLPANVQLTVGIPLHHTLGSPARSLDEIYERLGELPFTAEFKYDGQRAQIHASRKEDGNGNHLIRVFSRHLEEMTDKYPDVVSLVEQLFESYDDLESFIIDSEIVAIDVTDGSLRTFQELSNRARKDVRIEDIKVSVCVFAFDLMYYNGKILLEEPFRVRRDKLRSHLPPFVPDSMLTARFRHVESCESDYGREAVEEFWERAVDGRSEGLMIKLLDSGEVLEDTPDKKEKSRKKPLPATYEPDKRTSAWLKLKKDYVMGLGDSLDLVPIGAWHGNGRKAAWWSPVLLAVWDETVGQLVALCKCMSGFTDEFYKSMRERYAENSETCTPENIWGVTTGGLTPEVFFKPQEVWEIRGADITISPVSVAAKGLISADRGLSLRFPRFIKLREDKGIQEATTPEFVATIYRNQEGRGKQAKGLDEGDLIDASPEASEVEDENDDYDMT